MKNGSATIAVIFSAVSAAATVLLGLAFTQVYATANKASDQANSAMIQTASVLQSTKDLDKRLTRIEDKLDSINNKLK